MSLFSEIEKTIERGFRHWTERMFGPAESGELILVHRAILEEIETGIQVVARGRKVFPHAHLVITLVARCRLAASCWRLPLPAKTAFGTTFARRSRAPAAKCRAASVWISGPPKAVRARS